MRFCIVVLCLVLTVGVARGQEQCEIIPPRISKIKGKIAALRLDYPMTFQFVCLSLKKALEAQTPGEAVTTLGITYTGCVAVGNATYCNAVISEFVSVINDLAAIEKYAAENSCPVPKIPNPC